MVRSGFHRYGQKFLREGNSRTHLLGRLEHRVPKDLPKKTPCEVASDRLLMVGFLVFPVDLQGGLHFDASVFMQRNGLMFRRQNNVSVYRGFDTKYNFMSRV